VMFYGKGAGSLPTASAVVSDVVDAVKRTGATAEILWESTKREIGSADAFTTPYFVRIKGGDKAAVESAFGAVEYIDGKDGETAFITGVMSGSDFNKAAEGFDVVSRIRVSK
ncbi:MAG: homoserine dehydrogenase, partial [Lachnospiraceae bacterium]|nr:homoserine dehydrogenase [Lachnospiraceae bacterium]